MSDLPLVSISCITFNHAKFLRECFDGFLMQKTNFKFEVVIHDDASTDETKGIIEKYTNKYPDIFFPMYQKENQYSKGVRGMMVKFNFPRCRGKYIALCEGDDYWTDENKLQKQVDFLEVNPKSVLCFHQISKLFQDGSVIQQKSSQFQKNISNRRHLININYIATLSVVFKNDSSALERVAKFGKLCMGDYPLYLALLTKPDDEILFIDELMAVYRAGRPESVSNATDNKIFHQDCIKIYKALPSIYDNLNPDEKRSIVNGLARENMNIYKSYMNERKIVPSIKYSLKALYNTLKLKFLKGSNEYDYNLHSLAFGFKAGIRKYLKN